MKKLIKWVISTVLLSSLVLPGAACGEHTHTVVVDEAVAATCVAAGKTEGRHCSSCGEVLVPQEDIPKLTKHNYSEEWSSDKFYHWHACMQEGCTSRGDRSGHKPAVIEGYPSTTTSTGLSDGKYCSICNYVISEQTETPLHEHSFTIEEAHVDGFYSAATSTTGALFRKQCSCGEYGEETFEVPVDVSLNLEPTSPTMTLYEIGEAISYGFTWNTVDEPYVSVLAVKKASDSTFTYYEAEVKAYSSYDSAEAQMTFYVSKTEATLENNCAYEYKVMDMLTGQESDTFRFTTSNPNTEKFTFAAFSDSQTESSSKHNGAYFNKTLSNVSDVDFYVHSGDICEDSKHEQNWTDMLDYNKEYIATTPMMVAAGNHDTIYKSDGTVNEIFSHFNHNIPTQNTADGYYYSFTYGNAKFIVLNTNSSTSNTLLSDQYNWLVQQLKNNDKEWTIVVMHNPMYSVGKWGSNSAQNSKALALQTQLHGIFVDYGVDLVIQGHDHMISKTYPLDKNGNVVMADTETLGGISYQIDPQGPIYVMSGPAGNQGRGNSDLYSTYSDKYEYGETSKQCSWAEYSIDGNKLTVEVKYVNYDSGVVSTYYKWGIEKIDSSQHPAGHVLERKAGDDFDSCKYCDYRSYEMDTAPIAIELYDSSTSAYYANESFTFNAPMSTTITEVRLGDYTVFNGTKRITEGTSETLALNLTNFKSNRSADLGAQELTILCENAQFVYSVNVYTQIINSTTELQNWIAVSNDLKSLANGKADGYFILGENIVSEDYWNYSPLSARQNDGVGYTGDDPFDYKNSKGFVGTFDGNGFYVEKLNMKMNQGRNAFIPLLESKGVVKNVAFIDCRIDLSAATSENSGFLTAWCEGAISNVYMEVEIVNNSSSNNMAYSGLITARIKKGTASVSNVIVKATASTGWAGSYNDATYDIFKDTDSNSSGLTGVSNVFTIVGSGAAKDYNADVIVRFASENAMKDGNTTCNYASIFTSSVWTIVENMPVFSSTVAAS